MSNKDTQLSQKLQSYGQLVSPQSKRNTKNLSLQLNKPPAPAYHHQQQTVSSPKSMSFNMSTSPPSVGLYRHPSMSNSTTVGNQHSNGVLGLKRRATLSLSIPSEIEVSKNSGSAKLSSNSIPSFASASSSSSSMNLSSSPTSSSPIIPSTPKQLSSYSSFPSNIQSSTRSSHSSNSTLQSLPFNNNTNTNNNILSNSTSNGDLKTQTLIQNLSHISIAVDGDYSKLNAYPDGPACVSHPSLYLYSEPKLEQLKDFDLVINVAKELIPPIPFEGPLPKTSITHLTHKKLDYYYVPWTHTSKICQDLEFLTDILIDVLSDPTKKILIHCQCGVSRSASLIVALFMKIDRTNLNNAYNKLKESAPEISPNMPLIFQLMEWGDMIGVNNHNNLGNGSGGYCCGLSPQYEMQESPIGLTPNDNPLVGRQKLGDRKDEVIIHSDPYLASYN